MTLACHLAPIYQVRIGALEMYATRELHSSPLPIVDKWISFVPQLTHLPTIRLQSGSSVYC